MQLVLQVGHGQPVDDLGRGGGVLTQAILGDPWTHLGLAVQYRLAFITALDLRGALGQ